MRFEAGVLSSNPVAELGFERLLARGAVGLVLVGLQGLVVLGQEAHGIDLTGLLHEHRPAFGLSAVAAKTIRGFSGGEAHGGDSVETAA